MSSKMATADSKTEGFEKTNPDTVDGRPKQKGHLKNIFGKVAAVTSLAATLLFYSLGFNITRAYYDQWQENKAGVTQTQTWDHKNPTDDLPWLPAGGALAVSLGAGLAGIAAGRSRRRDHYNAMSSSGGSGYGSGYNNNYYSSNNDGFWWGYFLGSSNSRSSSSSSSSSSDDNGGAALAVVAVVAVGLAASASVVSYKALKENFGGPS